MSWKQTRETVWSSWIEAIMIQKWQTFCKIKQLIPSYVFTFKKVERELNAILLDLKNQEKLPEKTYRQLHSSDAIPPSIRGSIKHHKVDHPLRPIVTSIDSALYNTSKFLSQILSPLQNQNGFSVTNSTQFRNEISEMTISEDETMVRIIWCRFSVHSYSSWQSMHLH